MFRSHRAPRLRRSIPAVAAVAGCAVCVAPAPAPAAVAGANKAITVTANTSDVLLAGFGNLATVSVVRDGVTIATGVNKNVPGTTPAEGGINSAHLAGAGGCWTTFTPQLLTGDVIKVGADSTTVQGVTAEPLVVSGGQMIVRGTAVGPTGARLPAAEIDAQLWAPGGRFSQGSSGGQFLSAQGGDLGGIITYDSPTSSHWTARWPVPSSTADNAFALNSTVLGAWTGPAAAPATAGGEETDFEVGATPGPVAGCEAAAYAPDAPTGANVQAVNAANAGSDLVVTGKAQPNVTAVTVKLTDATGKAVTHAATLAGRDWTATFPASAVSGLADGTLTASGAFKIAAGTFHGDTLSLVKDTVAPAAPAASVPAGAYALPQSVTLSGDSGATIRYTTDGSDPTASSPRANGPVAIPVTATLKAIAVDPAGNASPVASFAYTIVGVGPSIAPARTLLRLEALRVSSRLTLRSVHRHGIRVLLTAPRGAKVVRVRLLRGRRVVSRVVRQVKGNRLMTVVLPRTRRGRRHLRAGTYRIEVTPGASKTDLGAATVRTVRIR